MFTKAFLLATLLALNISLHAADVSGKWVAETRSRGGTSTLTFQFKVDGSELTGTAQIGDGTPPTKIVSGRVEGDKLSFEVEREVGGATITTRFEGIISGDEIEMTYTRPGRGGGEPVPTKVVAKRSTT